jgi:hypothetical protein
VTGLAFAHQHRDWGSPRPRLHRLSTIAATSAAPGLGSPLPHLHRDSAHPWPHLRRHWAQPCHICTGTGHERSTTADRNGAEQRACADAALRPRRGWTAWSGCRRLVMHACRLLRAGVGAVACRCMPLQARFAAVRLQLAPSAALFQLSCRMLRENVLLVPFIFLNMLLYLGCAATLALGFFVRPSVYAEGVSYRSPYRECRCLYQGALKGVISTLGRCISTLQPPFPASVGCSPARHGTPASAVL